MSPKVTPLKSKIISLVERMRGRAASRHPEWCSGHWNTDRHHSDYLTGESSDTNLDGHPATSWWLRAVGGPAAAKVSASLHLAGWVDAAPRQVMLFDLPAADARALAHDLLRVVSWIEAGR